MITPELLKDPDYQLAFSLAKCIRQSGDKDVAWDVEDMAQGGELAIALYAAMNYFADYEIPVSYDDWEGLRGWFSHDGDDVDMYPNHYVVLPDEAEVFKKLKLTDE